MKRHRPDASAVAVTPVAIGTVLVLALFSATSCTAPRVPEGSRCVFNGDCRDPLVCAARVCRVACRTMSDCQLRQVCRPIGGGVSVCVPPGDPPFCGPDLACPSPLVCAIDGYCRAACRTDYDCRFMRADTHCTVAGVCEPNDGGVLDGSADASMDVSSDTGLDGSVESASMGDSTVDNPGADSPGLDVSHDVPLDAFIPDDVYPFDIPPTLEYAFHTRAPGEAGAHRCAVELGGGISCWGENRSGALGTGTASMTPTLFATPATVFPAGMTWISVHGSWVGGPYQSTTCALSTGGNVYCVGAGTYGQLGNGSMANSTAAVQVAGITTARQLSMSDGHACVVLASGSVMCWGNGVLGNMAAPSPSPTPVMVIGVTDATHVATAAQHNCLLRRTGQVMCWGSGSNGELGGGTPLSFVAEPVPVPGLATAVQLTAQQSNTCVRLMDGTARCWGQNTAGQVGSGTTSTSVATPTAVVGVSGIVDINSGGPTTCAVAGPERRVWCWGAPGALGAGFGGTTGLMPVQALGLRDVVALTSGGDVNTAGGYIANFCALRADDTLWCWGSNTQGELGNGTTGAGERPRPVPR